ncbi:MAG: glycosyltransferase family 2 protein [bacterium]|nr:glycosyltransferase family 2 protein [bacterium]
MISPELSVVIPALNEESNVDELYRELRVVLEGCVSSFEVIFVDDGSTDRTAQRVRLIHEVDSRVGLIKLSRNFGHQRALMCGFGAARGQAVVAMDADFQHPPEMIPRLVDRWREGAPVVQTVRGDGEGTGLLKRWTSRVFYAVIRRLTGMDIKQAAADFFLADRSVVEVLKKCQERSRFTRGLIAWVGFKRDFVAYNCGNRRHGRSKYTFGRMINLALDAVFSFSVVPLRLTGLAGLVATFLSTLYLAYVLAAKLLTKSATPGWASTIGVVVFLGGVQLVALWVMGEYLARIAEESRQRPPYVVDWSSSVMPTNGGRFEEARQVSAQERESESEVHV